MRLRSFTTVIIRIIGMMSIIYGLMTLLFVLFTVSMMSGMIASMSSVIGMQLLIPILMSAIGLILIVGSRGLAKALCGGLED
ncbi:MAG: hypothetical protein M3362_08275 [Acidobacteriota bacterium]|nr:hypothetical protein [Acidobacteriota bacterium]